MSSNFLKKCLNGQTDRQKIQIVEDSRSTNGSLENYSFRIERTRRHPTKDMDVKILQRYTRDTRNEYRESRGSPQGPD